MLARSKEGRILFPHSQQATHFLRRLITACLEFIIHSGERLRDTAVEYISCFKVDEEIALAQASLNASKHSSAALLDTTGGVPSLGTRKKRRRDSHVR